ncbi:MAG: phosphoribosylanthranilate isomerase [Actinobacteria bacterium]|nr:phosphoribosylanthranilate isomerase [Actinomycetota bacterium]
MTKIKICGITNIDDALAAAELGTDAIGFVFAESPRRVSVRDAAGISSALPPFVLRIGVFVDETADEIIRAVEACALDGVQLHGENDLDISERPGLRKIRIVRIRTREDIERAARMEADAVLLDSKVEGSPGGTGVKFDWSLLSGVSFASPLMLSGGLRVDDVSEAIRLVKPYAVDVSSGVESSPGQKDRAKIKAFIEAVRRMG